MLHYDSGMTTTDQDMRDQVTATLKGSGESVEGYDVHAIVSELQQIFGTMDIENMPHDIFWGTVEKHSNVSAASNVFPPTTPVLRGDGTEEYGPRARR